MEIIAKFIAILAILIINNYIVYKYTERFFKKSRLLTFTTNEEPVFTVTKKNDGTWKIKIYDKDLVEIKK